MNPANRQVASLSLLLALGASAQTLPAPPLSPAPVVNLEYDANGNPTKTIAAAGIIGFNFANASSYDALNRIKDRTDAKAGVTRFGYDGREGLSQLTDPRSLVTQYARDGLGNITSIVSPDTGAATKTYDAAGNMLTSIDSRGVKASHTYDGLNRLTSVLYSQTGQATLSDTYNYDQTGASYSNGIGRLTSASSSTGTVHRFTYDSQGRVVNTSQDIFDDSKTVYARDGSGNTLMNIISRRTGYSYDAGGNLTSIRYPSGRKLIIAYTAGVPSALALAQDASTVAINLVTQIQWEPFGGVKSWLWQMGAGTQVYERMFDIYGRLVRYPLGSYIRDVTYDAGDRITAYTHYLAATAVAAPNLDQSFSYDPLGQLTGVMTGASSWSIAYDANGNRTGLMLNGMPSTYTVAASSNRLSSTTSPARGFSYDNAGNTTSDGQFTANYSLAGRMVALTKAGITTTYRLDAFGRRVMKTSSAGSANSVVFVYDQNGNLLGEYSTAGVALREYVWLGDTPVAVFTPDPANATNPPLVYYVHTDHLNTPRVVFDKSNRQRWYWFSEPFGMTAANDNPQNLGAFTFNLRFPGQYFSQESALFYNYFRDYDTLTGRYTQSDPIGLAGGINTYAYVGGNPISRIDPMGLDTIIVINRLGSTGTSIAGTIGVTSTVTGAQFFGYTLENANPPNAALPVPPGTYSAFVRTDHSPNRIELTGVPSAKNVQLHVGNTASDLIGCFAPGTSRSKDSVGGSTAAMAAINGIIQRDGGAITVIVIGGGRP